MNLPPYPSLTEVYESAVRQHLQRALRSGEDWDRFKRIQRETDARLMAEQAEFKRDHAMRISEAKQIILREENGVRFDQPLPPWAERRSNADDLHAKAMKRVRSDHERRVAKIKRDETDAFRDLTADIRARDAPQRAKSLTQTWNQGRSGPSRS